MRNENFMTGISAIMTQTCYNAIHRRKQVVYWSNIAPPDCASKLVQYGAILDESKKDVTLFSKKNKFFILTFI